MPLQDFDARNVQPQQGIGAHPPGIHDAVISHTYLKETKDGQGLMLTVEFSTPAGKIDNRYNIYNKSQQAMDIAQKELSALCHAANVYKITYRKNPDGSPIFDQAAMELRNARCRIEVAPQMKNGEPTQFMEIKTVFDVNGNAPGKGGAAPQPQQPAQQSGGWNNAPPQQPVLNQQPPQGQPQAQQWGGGQPQPQPSATQQPPQPAWGGATQQQQPPQGQPPQGQPAWTPGPAGNGNPNPPWK